MYDFVYALEGSFFFTTKAYRYADELIIKLKNNKEVIGVVIEAKKNGIKKAVQNYRPAVLGYEGAFPTDYSFCGNFNTLITPGINLNLAVIIYNLRTKLQLMFGRNTKGRIALCGVCSDTDKIIAHVFTAILGEITLVGENYGELKELAEELFANFGVFTPIAEKSENCKGKLILNVADIMLTIAKVNFRGIYFSTHGKYFADYIFSAPLAETILLAGNCLDKSTYNPFSVSAENVYAVARVAKKNGFLPIFHDIKNFLEVNNKAYPTKEYLDKFLQTKI